MTFADPSIVQEVCKKRPHMLDNKAVIIIFFAHVAYLSVKTMQGVVY